MASSNVQYFEGQLASVALVAPVTLSGAVTLTDAAGYNGNILKLDPGGASRNVTLWPEEQKKGVVLFIINGADGAENLVIKDDAANTVVTINQNEAALLQCNGTAWVLLCVVTIALS